MKKIFQSVLLISMILITLSNSTTSIARVIEFETEIRTTVEAGGTILGSKYKFEVIFDQKTDLRGFDANDIKVTSGKVASFTKVKDGVYTFEVTGVKGSTFTITIPDGVVLSGDNMNLGAKRTVNVDSSKKAKAHLIMSPVKSVYKTGDEINFKLYTDDDLLLQAEETYLVLSGATSQKLLLTKDSKTSDQLFGKEGASEFNVTYRVPYKEGEVKIAVSASDLAGNTIDTALDEYTNFSISKKDLQLVITKDSAGKELKFVLNDKVTIDRTKIKINGEAMKRNLSTSPNDLTYTYKLDFSDTGTTVVTIEAGAIKSDTGAVISPVTYNVAAGSDGNIEAQILGLETKISSINSIATLESYIKELNTFLTENPTAKTTMLTRIKDICEELIQKYVEYVKTAFIATTSAKEIQYEPNATTLANVTKLKEQIINITKNTNVDVTSLNYIELSFTSKNTLSLSINDYVLKDLKNKGIDFKAARDTTSYLIPSNFAYGETKYRLRIENVIENNEYTSYAQVGRSHKISLIAYTTSGTSVTKELNTPITVNVPISEVGSVYYEYVRGAYKDSSSATTAYDFNVTQEEITAKLTKLGTYFLFVSKETNTVVDETDVEVTFKDIENHWAKEYIMMLVKEGITSGVSKDKFGPSQNVTRSQAATFIVKACNLNLATTYNNKFKDVAEGRWYTTYVETAANNSLINGYTDGTFRPDGNLTRQEMIVMIMKAYEKNTGISVGKITGSVTFKDEATIATWALPSIKAAGNLGFIAGDKEGNFNPTKNITRAEVSKIIASYLIKVRSV